MIDGLAGRCIPMPACRLRCAIRRIVPADVAHTQRKPRVASGIPAVAASRPARYIRSIMALPKPEQETWVAPGMSRAKS